MTVEMCFCPVGSTFLGLSVPSPRRAATVQKFLIEGEKFSNVGIMDPSIRHLITDFKDSDLIFSPPFFIVRSIIESIPLSTAGTAEPGIS